MLSALSFSLNIYHLQLAESSAVIPINMGVLLYYLAEFIFESLCLTPHFSTFAAQPMLTEVAGTCTYLMLYNLEIFSHTLSNVYGLELEGNCKQKKWTPDKSIWRICGSVPIQVQPELRNH